MVFLEKTDIKAKPAADPTKKVYTELIIGDIFLSIF